MPWAHTHMHAHPTYTKQKQNKIFEKKKKKSGRDVLVNWIVLTIANVKVNKISKGKPS